MRTRTIVIQTSATILVQPFFIAITTTDQDNAVPLAFQQIESKKPRHASQMRSSYTTAYLTLPPDLGRVCLLVPNSCRQNVVLGGCAFQSVGTVADFASEMSGGDSTDLGFVATTSADGVPTRLTSRPELPD